MGGMCAEPSDGMAPVPSLYGGCPWPHNLPARHSPPHLLLDAFQLGLHSVQAEGGKQGGLGARAALQAALVVVQRTPHRRRRRVQLRGRRVESSEWQARCQERLPLRYSTNSFSGRFQLPFKPAALHQGPSAQSTTARRLTRPSVRKASTCGGASR